MKRCNRILIIFLFLFPLYSIPARDSNKHVIGAWNGGLFACLLVACNHLAWCDYNHKTPVIYWGEKSLYFNKKGFNGSKNVWEYYFQPVSALAYKKGDRINANYMMTGPGNPKFHYMGLTPEIRQAIFKLLKKYVKIKPVVQQKINSFYNCHMRGIKTIGIHLRGTDKYKEVQPVTPEQVAEIALKYANCQTQFFIASDENAIINRLAELLQGYTVLSYQCYRSSDGKPIHYNYSNRAQAGEDVLVEVSLLAQCDMLIHSLSNVSSFVLYFNPEMPHHVVCND